MSKPIIAGILKNVEGQPKGDAKPQEVLAGVPTSSQVLADLRTRAWAAAPANNKAVSAGRQRIMMEHDGKRILLDLEGASENELRQVLNLYDKPTIEANLKAARNDFYTLCDSVTEGIALLNMKALNDPEMSDGIAFAANGKAVYWKKAAPGFVASDSKPSQIKTKIAEFELKPGILAALDAVNLQLLADQTGTTIHQLRRMDRSNDPKVLAELAVRVAAVLDVFKFDNEREATFAELKTAVASLTPTVKAAWTDKVQNVYKSLEELKQFDDVYHIASRLGYDDVEALWNDNPEISGSTNPVDLKVVSAMAVKAAAITKTFNEKGEQSQPTEKDHRSDLLDDKKRPAVVIDKTPSKDPLKPKDSLYSAKEVSLADLQKPDSKFALAQWCETMEEAKKTAKALELRRTDLMPQPDHGGLPPAEADGEGLKKVKDPVSGDDRLAVKEIKEASSVTTIQKPEDLDNEQEQLAKIRRGEVMAASFFTISFKPFANNKGDQDDVLEATIKPENDDLAGMLRTLDFEETGTPGVMEGRRLINGVETSRLIENIRNLADGYGFTVTDSTPNVVILEPLNPPKPKVSVKERLQADAKGHQVNSERTEEHRKFEEGLFDPGSLESEDVDGADVRIYDNGGETFDRYTIVVENPETQERSWLGSSTDPFHPQGFGQHLGDNVQEGEHLGRKVKFSELPPKVQQFVRQEAKAMVPVQASIKAAFEVVEEKDGLKLWVDWSRSKKGSGEFADDVVHPFVMTEGDAKPEMKDVGNWMSEDEFKTPSGSQGIWSDSKWWMNQQKGIKAEADTARPRRQSIEVNFASDTNRVNGEMFTTTFQAFGPFHNEKAKQATIKAFQDAGLADVEFVAGEKNPAEGWVVGNLFRPVREVPSPDLQTKAQEKAKNDLSFHMFKAFAPMQGRTMAFKDRIVLSFVAARPKSAPEADAEMILDLFDSTWTEVLKEQGIEYMGSGKSQRQPYEDEVMKRVKEKLAGRTFGRAVYEIMEDQNYHHEVDLLEEEGILNVKGSVTAAPKKKREAKDRKGGQRKKKEAKPAKEPEAEDVPKPAEEPKAEEAPEPTSGGEDDFETKARNLLAKALGVEPDDLKARKPYFPYDQPGKDVAAFDHGNEEYTVFPEDDADDYAKASVRNDIESEGLQLFNQDFIMGHVDRDGLKSFMEQVHQEWLDQDVEELDSKEKEAWLEQKGLLPDNYLEDENFDVDNFFDGHREDWIEEQVQERLGNDGGESYWRDNFGDEDFMKLVFDNNLIDEDEVVEEAVAVDGAGHFLSAYDGDLHDIGDGLVYARWN